MLIRRIALLITCALHKASPGTHPLKFASLDANQKIPSDQNEMYIKLFLVF